MNKFRIEMASLPERTREIELKVLNRAAAASGSIGTELYRVDDEMSFEIGS